MRDCSICYEEKEKFHDLSCCSNNFCIECFEQLRNPQCPFCRTVIIHRRFRSMTMIEADETPREILFENYYLLHATDDMYVNTRWFRRHRRRLQRLREREHMNERNRELSRLRREERQKQQEEKQRQQRKKKKQEKRELRQELEEF